MSAISCSSGSDCVAVGSVLDRYGVVVPLAMGWDGSSWSTQAPAVPAGATRAVLTAVSCSGGTCLAVGGYTTDTGSVPLAERWDGSSWTQQTAANPTGMAVSQLNVVSCTSATVCVVVGAALGADGTGAPLAEQVNGSTWTPWTLPEPPGTSYFELNAISCASASMCMAVGSSDPGDVAGTALVEEWNGATWTATNLPRAGPSGFQNALEAVSCPSSGWCAAVGDADGVGAQALAETWNGSDWTMQPTPGLESYAQLSAISCRSAGDCVAAGYMDATSPVNGLDEQVPIAEGWDGLSWTQQTLASEPGLSATLTGVACPIDGPCRAVGQSTQDGTAIQLPIVQASSAGTWSNDPMPDTNGGESSALQAVSCPNANFCMAVGQRPYGPLGASLAEQSDGTAWTPTAPPNPAGWVDSSLDGVSCTSSTFCMAVGDWQVSSDANPVQPQQPLAVSWDGSQWSVALPPPSPRYTIPDLRAVSCTATSFCMAVGETSNGVESAPAADQWDGTGWTTDAVPRPGASSTSPGEESHLTGVSCVAATACTAVGYLRDQSGVYHALAETWDGSAWTIVGVPDPNGSTDTRLNQVSCWASGCEATGNEYDVADGYQSFAEGGSSVSTWAVQPTPRPPLPSLESGLAGISCASAVNCEAVGYYFPVTAAMFAARWDGVSWSAAAPPNTSPFGYAVLFGVSCTATDQCTAVGDQQGTNTLARAELFSGVAPTPASSSPPTITGIPVPGQELSVQTGSWSGSPSSYYYEWEDCDANGANCTRISGASGTEYEVAPSDVGYTIEALEYANDAGSVGGPAASAPTGIVAIPTLPSDTLAPSITGSAAEGDTLTVVIGVWDGNPTGYTYSWSDCDPSGANCVQIFGATASTYRLTANDVGHTIRASVTAVNAVGTGTAATSNATPIVLPAWLPTTTITPPPPTTPQPKPRTPTATLAILTGRATIHRRRLGVMVRCASVAGGLDRCSGILALVRTVPVRHAHRPSTTRTVTLAHATYSIPADQSRSIQLRLSRPTVRLVNGRPGRKLIVTTKALVAHGATRERRLVLIASPI